MKRSALFFSIVVLGCGSGGGTSTTTNSTTGTGGAGGTTMSTTGTGGATSSTSSTTSSSSTTTTSTSTSSSGTGGTMSTGGAGGMMSTGGAGGTTMGTGGMSAGGSGGGTSDAGVDAGCGGGQVDCGTGCTDTQTDSSNCGMCGTTCTGGTSCVNGACVCTGGQTLCNNTCVDTKSDPANCGMCNQPCAGGFVCNAGTCALSCAPGLVDCNGACVAKDTDPNHCGMCGNVCPKPPNTVATCMNGLCGITCTGSFADCDNNPGNGCETDKQTSASHCGTCGNTCPGGANATPICTAGMCALQCAPGFSDCNNDPSDGCETDLSLVTSCGMCGNTCTAGPNAMPVCTANGCTYVCTGSYADCDMNPANGCEIDKLTDTSHCGMCGNVCPTPPNATATCINGTCGIACNGSYGDCDMNPANGCETDKQTDPSHCGTCGNTCSLPNATATCTMGMCAVGTCDITHADCDNGPGNGCEVDTTSDTGNCGGCGYVCSTANATSAACLGAVCKPACATGYTDCNGPQAGNIDDGCEINTAADVNNCGQCGNQCAAGHKCCTGGCQDTTSCTLTITGVQGIYGWQNGGDWVTIKGTGFTTGAKVYFADGQAPALTRDAQTIIVQTPPHASGYVDVKIVQGAEQVTLHNGFLYVSKGLQPPWQLKPMSKVRGEIPALAVLQDGRVLVAGGTTVPDQPGNSLNTAEVFDRVNDTVTFTGNTMSTPRWRNNAITMLTGKVLLTGGCGGCAGGNAAAVDIYDPATNLFTAGPSLPAGLNDIHAVLMVDGRVFVSSATNGNIYLYNPTTNTWKTITHAQGHPYGFVVRLRDGRVMIGGGDAGVKVVELFDPYTETFTVTGSLATGRSMLTAHTLPDSRVIVIGGTNVSAGAVNAPQKTMEVWSPATGAWTTLPYQLTNARCWHASALVRDGTILVMGGYPTNGSCTPTPSVEKVDPVAGTVSAFAALGHANTEWVAATLLDGSVIGVGGGACGTSSALPDLDFLAGAQ